MNDLYQLTLFTSCYVSPFLGSPKSKFTWQMTSSSSETYKTLNTGIVFVLFIMRSIYRYDDFYVYLFLYCGLLINTACSYFAFLTFTLFKSNRTLRQLILNGNYVQSYAIELIYQKKKRKMNILNNNHNSEIKVRLCISANYVKYI